MSFHPWPRLLARSLPCLALLTYTGLLAPAVSAAGEPFVLNDDGGWCWFQDERVLVHGGKLWVVSVASGRTDVARKGNVEVVTRDLAAGTTTRFVLHPQLHANDHATPALLALPDGRVVTVYSGHNHPRMFHRTTERPNDATAWTPATEFVPGEGARVTYANLAQLSAENGRLYNFFRGHDPQWKPSWMTSDDAGRTWTARGLWIDQPGPERHRPYVKYISNGRDEIHFVFTEGHPANYDNSLYHAVYRGGHFHRSDGERIQAVSAGPVMPAQATRIFAGDARNIAWPCDLHLDADGHPVAVYSVQRSSGRLPPGDPAWGQDLRYRYARWDGARWIDQEIARAGTRLYPKEDHYTGLAAVDPADPATVFISSDVDPVSGEALAGGRHQIFLGRSGDRGRSFRWEQLTRTPDADNLRPVVPMGSPGGRVALVWMRGQYRTYTDYDLEMVGLVLPSSR
jgi:hypothetical protein